jgi:hypothetical protein
VALSVKAVFGKLADLTESITYRAAGTSSYNAATGVVTQPYTDLAARAFVVAYRDRQIDGVRIRTGDRQLVIERLALEAAADAAPVTLAPTLNDRIVWAGKTWVPVHIDEDPATAVLIIQMREPQ